MKSSSKYCTQQSVFIYIISGYGQDTEEIANLISFSSGIYDQLLNLLYSIG